jgi:succinyl-CoA synthetase beta subunit
MADVRTLSEHDSKQVLVAHGVRVAAERIVADLDGARSAVAELGWPVVVKACGDSIAHKTERGLVVLGVSDDAALERSVVAILSKLGPDDGDAKLLIAEMVSGNRELICGVDVNPQFGPVLMIGMGGILAEALEDVAFRALPADRADVLEMLDELRGARLLDSFRGEPAVDRMALADAIVSIGQAALSVRGLQSLDVNPIIIVDGAAVAVDALIVQEVK